jgi:hypothetical protein
MYIIALKGSEEERPMASTILCGASLTRGWNFQVVMLISNKYSSNFGSSIYKLFRYNISGLQFKFHTFCYYLFQEHAVRLMVKLLSPSSSFDSSEIEIENHYVCHMRMLNALLLGMASIDTVHILSLYGLVSKTL